MLLDTCVLSDMQRPTGSPVVRAFVESLDAGQIFLSVLTIGELAKGIALLVPGTRKQSLSEWLSDIELRFEHRVLPIDVEVARLWGDLTARAQTKGIQIPASDGLIAATALRHGLEVVTRNTRHFEATGAIIVDPWATSEASTT
jgi:predicted nucleic acid-binding protein